MGDDNQLLVIGVIIAFPAIFFFLKVWLFATGTPGSTFHRVQRIAELDAHIPFDERLAERLRQLEQDKSSAIEAPSTPPASPGPPPRGFGRRGL